MHTVTLAIASQDLRGLILKIIKDKDETVIATDNGSVVVMEESEWSHVKETLRLLSDKESLAALIESHRIRDRDEVPVGISPDEAFKDV